MTAEEIAALIDINLASNTRITAVNHRSVEHALLDYITENLPKSGDIKPVYKDATYLAANFDETGLGINLRAGEALCNGNNGTPNLTGRTIIHYSGDYPLGSGATGSQTATLTKNNIPKLDLTAPVSDADNGGGSKVYIMATDLSAAGTHTYLDSVNASSPTTPVSIMQPSYPMFYVMKL